MLSLWIFFLRFHLYLGCLFDNKRERHFSYRSPICFEPSLSLTDFSPIMRASVACGASAQRKRTYQRSGTASGALPYAVKKSVFHIHRCLVFEIVDMHCLIPKYVSGATLISARESHQDRLWYGVYDTRKAWDSIHSRRLIVGIAKHLLRNGSKKKYPTLVFISSRQYAPCWYQNKRWASIFVSRIILANFTIRDSGMLSLPSRDCSPNSSAKIVIFQTDARFMDKFSSLSSLCWIYSAKIGKPHTMAEIIVNL